MPENYSDPEKTIDKKINEIEETIKLLQNRKDSLDQSINEKISEVVKKQLKDHKLHMTPQEYEVKNPEFFQNLRKELLSKYEQVLTDNINGLERSRAQLLRIRNL